VPFKRMVDASPLILLTKVGRTDLLELNEDFPVQVVIPSVVYHEISSKDQADPVVQVIKSAGWSVLPPTPQRYQHFDLNRLDDGERSVLELALQEPDCEVILDDHAARQYARAHNIKLLGTIGLVLLAKKLGLIEAVRPLLADIRWAGLYVADSVIDAALEQAGE
jgi:uncharacterized protein